MLGFVETPLSLAMGLFHSCADVIFPPFLQPAMIHEKSGICPNPAFPVEAQPPAGDDQMDVGMPLHVGTKSVDDNKYAHTHFLDVTSPLLNGFGGCLANKIAPCFSIHHDHDAQLPWDGHNQVMISHV
jgi:hypothetical protein